MNKEKEIEEILQIMHNCIYLTHIDCAIALVNAGYGNVKQAVKEFCNKLKAQIRKQADDYYVGRTAMYELGVDEQTMDTLFIELYGADE